MGGVWHFTNTYVTCWKSHAKLSTYRAWPPLASITTIHIHLKLQVSWLQDEKCMTTTKWALVRGRPGSLVELAEHWSDLLLEYVPYMLYLTNIKEGGRPIIRSIFCAQCTHWQHKPGADRLFHPRHGTSIRVHTCRKELI